MKRRYNARAGTGKNKWGNEKGKANKEDRGPKKSLYDGLKAQ